MDSDFTCSHGHRWRRPPSDGSPNLCPVCGAAPLPSSDPSAQKPDDPSTTKHTLLPGYELLGQAGIGGMGIVFRARQQKTGLTVAVKMLRDDEQSLPDSPRRFQREVQCLANLDHPNIVKAHESGVRDGVAYLIMEYLEGSSLFKRLNGSAMPPREAAQLLKPIAEAVHHAHERGIIHRNLKPHDILFTADGTPKLIDFGLARVAGKDDAPFGEGVVVGTPSYMSPEQAAGRSNAVGPATDVFGLGAVLYECLTGRPPFVGPSPIETLMRVRDSEPVPPRSLNKQADREIESVCLRCLRKEPRDRYASAQAVAEDLGRYLDNKPVLGRRFGFWRRLFGRL
jgi:eukaryotic-like serine/threonine-protein kinase